jgi:flagellar protein FlbD
VILVHRLRGEPFYVNPDVIESVESTPDTVLTLVDGRRILVDDAPEQIVARFNDYRVSLLVAAEQLRSGPPVLSVVPDEER